MSLVSEAAYQAALVDDFDAFLAARAAHLQELALKMSGATVAGEIPSEGISVSSSATDDSDSDTSD